MSERERYEELLGAVALYIPWRYVTGQLTTEQKDLFADAVEADARRVGLSASYAHRWWRDDVPAVAASEGEAESHG